MNVTDLYTVEAHDEGADLNIKDPNTRKPIENCFITIAGPDSKIFRKAEKLQYKKTLLAMASDEENADDLIEKDAEFLAEITLGWRGIDKNDQGDALEFSKEEAKKLYLNAPFIRDQVNTFSQTRANFTKG